jgi:hypothetical protein
LTIAEVTVCWGRLSGRLVPVAVGGAGEVFCFARMEVGAQDVDAGNPPPVITKTTLNHNATDP